MASESVRIDFDAPIPLFPLPNCVLLPHATVPLHVFEARYRAMVGDALDGSGLIAMAVFAGDPRKGASMDAFDPPLREHVCVGRILKHDQLAGGRYNMLVNGLCRARITRELEPDATGYRQAMLEATEGQPQMEIDLDAQRRKLESLLHDQELEKLAAVSSIHHWLHDEVPTPALTDLATLTLCRAVDERYPMLAEPDPAARVHWLNRYLERTRQTLVQADRLGQAKTEEGYSLN